MISVEVSEEFCSNVTHPWMFEPAIMISLETFKAIIYWCKENNIELEYPNTDKMIPLDRLRADWYSRQFVLVNDEDALLFKLNW